MATTPTHWLEQDDSTDQSTWQAKLPVDQTSDPMVDVLSVAEQAGLHARSTDIPPSMEHKISVVTAYGTPDVVQQYNEDIQPYKSAPTWLEHTSNPLENRDQRR